MIKVWILMVLSISVGAHAPLVVHESRVATQESCERLGLRVVQLTKEAGLVYDDYPRTAYTCTEVWVVK